MIVSSEPAVGGAVADADPRRLAPVGLGAIHSRAAAHDDVRGEHAEQQAAVREPRERDGAVAAPQRGPAASAITTASAAESAIAPATCTNSGRFHSSGRTIASITPPA